MKIFSLILLSYFLSFSVVHADAITHISANILHFNYQEFDLDNDSLNEEDGYLPGFTLSIKQLLSSLKSELSFEFYGGEVDYDGQTQIGLPLTSKTTTEIYKVSYQLKTYQQNDAFNYYASLGWQQWNRDIQSTSSTARLFEQYNWWVIDAGFNISMIRSETHQFSFDVGVLKILGDSIKIDLSQQGFGEPTLDLGDGTGFNTALRYSQLVSQQSKIVFSLQHERWDFSRSPSETISNGFIFVNIVEPRSESERTTLSVSYQLNFE